MKKNRKYLGLLTTLLIVSPCLLGLNKYSEMNYEYTQLEVTVIDHKEDPENENVSLYDLNIKNNDKGYIYSIKYRGKDSNSTSFLIKDDSSPVMNSPLLKPYGECVYSNLPWSSDSVFPNGSFIATAYDRFSFSLEEGFTSFIKDESRDDIYYFECSSLPNLSIDYGYNYAATMNYDGVEHNFIVSLNNNKFAIRTKNSEFDVNKASITKIDVFSYEKYNPHYEAFIFGGLLFALIPVAVVGVIIAISVVVPIIIVTTIHRKKRANNK